MIYVLSLLPIVVVGMVFLALGHSRAGVLFSTSVPVDFPSSPIGKRILRNYRWGSAFALIVFLAFGVIAVQRGRIDFDLIAIPVEIATWFSLYYIAVYQTRPFGIQPPLVHTASLSWDPSTKPMIVGMIAALVPLAAAAVYLHLHWAQSPPFFPSTGARKERRMDGPSARSPEYIVRSGSERRSSQCCWYWGSPRAIRVAARSCVN